MAGKYGTAEVRDVVLFVKTMVIRGLEMSKDGKLTPEDLQLLFSDPQLVGDFFKALEGSDQVKKELNELDFLDGLELSRFIYNAVSDIVGALRS